MTKRTRNLLGIYFCIGALLYVIVKIFVGGLGIIGLGGLFGDIVEFLLVTVAWPLVVLLTILVVMQGR